MATLINVFRTWAALEYGYSSARKTPKKTHFEAGGAEQRHVVGRAD